LDPQLQASCCARRAAVAVTDLVLVVENDRPYATLLKAEGVTTDLAESRSARAERLAERGHARVVPSPGALPDGLALDRLLGLVRRLPRTSELSATAVKDVVASIEASETTGSIRSRQTAATLPTADAPTAPPDAESKGST
jgi:hypothetical protein